MSFDPTYTTPHAKQLLRAIQQKNGPRVIAVNGGVGSGKSYAIAQAILLVAVTRPGVSILVSAGSLNLLLAVLKKRCDEVFGEHAEWKGGNSHPHYLFSNGSTATFRPYQMYSTRDESDNPWEGRDYNFLIVDEEVEGGARILTPNGYRTIEELCKDSYRGMVLGLDHETGLPCWTRVTNSKQYGPGHERRSFELTFSNGQSLKASGNHPIWLDGIGYVSTQSLYDSRDLDDEYLYPVRHEGLGRAYLNDRGRFYGVHVEGREPEPLDLVAVKEITPIIGGCDLTTELRNYFANGILTHNCEQLPDTVFEHSLQRCRLSHTDISGIRHEPTVVWVGRPGAVDHWIRKTEELAERGLRTLILRPKTRDNPLLWETDPETGQKHNPYLEQLRASLSKEEFECITQEVEGATMPLDGSIYDNFVPVLWPEGNLVDLPDLKGPTTAVIDFGVTTTAVLWIQERRVRGKDVHVIIDEWCPDEPTSTQDIVKAVLARGHALSQVIVDPAGNARQRASGLVSEVDILRRPVNHDPDGLGGGLGVPVISTPLTGERRRVKAGIMRTQARICSASGERTLLVSSDLWNNEQYNRGIKHTIRQYVWDPKTGEPKKGKKGNDADHVADTLRLYVVRKCWDGDAEETPKALSPPRKIAPRAANITRRNNGKRGRQR